MTMVHLHKVLLIGSSVCRAGINPRMSYMCKAVNITPCNCWRAREDTDMPVINITTAVATPNYTDNSEIC